MIEELKTINETLLLNNQNNPTNLKKYQLIKQILNNPNCFFKIDIKYAYSILKDLQINEDKIESTYLELINYNNFKKQD